MKIAIDRMSVLAKPPLALSVSDAGEAIVTLYHDGTTLHVALSPVEARSLGVQLIENGAVATLVRAQKPPIERAG